MNLYAISDLHVGYEANRRAVAAMPAHRDDWLILAGDVGERLTDLAFVVETLGPKFARLIWVPGNHELWTLPDEEGLRGEARYLKMVELCRERGVLTPEDPYPRWPGDGPARVIAPLFLLYDYSFGPPGLGPDAAIAWALEHDLVCGDEVLLHPDPYPSRQAWCAQRVAHTERRLAQIDPSCRTILVNHYPLRYEHVTLPRIPRFSIWCGTRTTEDWHRRFRAECVVYGHLHVRATRVLDGVRFEEVSFGYPPQRPPGRTPESYLRRILPPPPPGEGERPLHR